VLSLFVWLSAAAGEARQQARPRWAPWKAINKCPTLSKCCGT